MPQPLQLLVVVNRTSDAEAWVAQLARAGFAPQWQALDSEQHLLDALKTNPDVVLADFQLPRFGANRLLQILQERAIDIPLIFISGSVGEDTAVETIHRGAADFVLSSRLSRLGPAVRASLHRRGQRAQQRSAEEALRTSEERLRLALNAGQMGLWQWDPRTGLAVWNEREYELLGLPVGNGLAPPNAIFDALHPDDVDRVRAEVQRCLDSWSDLDTEMRIVRPDGQIRWLGGRGRVYRDSAGRPVQMVGVNYDITERKQAEHALRSSQRMLETVMNNIPQGVFWKDRNSVYLGCNSVVLKSRGFTRAEEIVGKSDFDLPGLTREQAEYFVEKDREVVESGQPQLGIVEPMTLADGTTIWLETSKLPLHDSENRVIGLLGTWQDITERRRLEEQLRQSQKMEAIGRLAGGVAHDFNNLLTVILGYSELALGAMNGDDAEARGHVAAIRDAGERASALTRQLLAFSRKQLLEPKVLDLNEVISTSQQLLRRLIGEDIMLATVLDPALPRVKVDPGQIEQVILNLVVNARDAMPGGGRITIETRSVHIPAADSAGHSAKENGEALPGHYARVSVRDTGDGMTPEVQARVFEPFYTTKGPGRGTGLGLATVYGIVKQSDGWIDVASEIGAGAAFDVYLPAVDATAPTAAGASAAGGLQAGRETLLLVEDDSAVRVLTRAALEKCGYRVLEAAGGPEAVEIAEAHAGTIDLLISDVVMPEMSGRQLAETLAPRRREMKVLLVSGYTEDAMVRHDIAEANSAFLQKPFTLATLAKKAREVLDQPA